MSTLFQAIRSNDLDQVIELLADKKTNINEIDICGRTSLMVASFNGYINIVNLLLEKGANINIKDKQNRTALEWSKLPNKQANNDNKLKILKILEKKQLSPKSTFNKFIDFIKGNPPNKN